MSTTKNKKGPLNFIEKKYKPYCHYKFDKELEITIPLIDNDLVKGEENGHEEH